MLDKKLNDNHDLFFPLKTVKKHPKFIYKPSKESLNAIKTKNKLYKKFKVLLKKLQILIVINVMFVQIVLKQIRHKKIIK